MRKADKKWLDESGNRVAFDARVMGLRTSGVGLASARAVALAEIRGVEVPSARKQARKPVSEERECSYDRGVEWVAANLANEAVSYVDRPSDAAWGMLVWARGNGTSTQAFWTTCYAKIAPAKAQRELEAMQADDMRAVDSLVARVLRLAVKARDAEESM